MIGPILGESFVQSAQIGDGGRSNALLGGAKLDNVSSALETGLKIQNSIEAAPAKAMLYADNMFKNILGTQAKDANGNLIADTYNADGLYGKQQQRDSVQIGLEQKQNFIKENMDKANKQGEDIANEFKTNSNLINAMKKTINDEADSQIQQAFGNVGSFKDVKDNLDNYFLKVAGLDRKMAVEGWRNGQNNSQVYNELVKNKGMSEKEFQQLMAYANKVNNVEADVNNALNGELTQEQVGQLYERTAQNLNRIGYNPTQSAHLAQQGIQIGIGNLEQEKSKLKVLELINSQQKGQLTAQAIALQNQMDEDKRFHDAQIGIMKKRNRVLAEQANPQSVFGEEVENTSPNAKVISAEEATNFDVGDGNKVIVTTEENGKIIRTMYDKKDVDVGEEWNANSYQNSEIDGQGRQIKIKEGAKGQVLKEGLENKDYTANLINKYADELEMIENSYEDANPSKQREYDKRIEFIRNDILQKTAGAIDIFDISDTRARIASGTKQTGFWNNADAAAYTGIQTIYGQTGDILHSIFRDSKIAIRGDHLRRLYNKSREREKSGLIVPKRDYMDSQSFTGEEKVYSNQQQTEPSQVSKYQQIWNNTPGASEEEKMANLYAKAQGGDKGAEQVYNQRKVMKLDVGDILNKNDVGSKAIMSYRNNIDELAKTLNIKPAEIDTNIQKKVINAVSALALQNDKIAKSKEVADEVIKIVYNVFKYGKDKNGAKFAEAVKDYKDVFSGMIIPGFNVNAPISFYELIQSGKINELDNSTLGAFLASLSLASGGKITARK